MMQKRTILRLFLGLEIIVFGWFYYHGVRGMQSVQQLRKENDLIVMQIEDIQREVQELDHQIVAWNDDPSTYCS